MKLNLPTRAPRTHEGGPALPALPPLDQLRRAVMACVLWESGFYEDGERIADRIKRLVPLCKGEDVAALAFNAREYQRLRHVPLLLVRELARHPDAAAREEVHSALFNVIQRADELCEFLAIYWLDGKEQPLSAQVKRGLAMAFNKFNAYQLGKYNRDGAVKLRDVLFLCHAKPMNEEQAAVWKQLVDGTLPAPDTWEVALSAGADKRATFERLLSENKLGYLALLRNLRGMLEVGVPDVILRDALLNGAGSSKALPFRYVAAARHAPQLEPALDDAMQIALGSLAKMSGKTAVLVDVSGSMDAKISSKSDLSRLDAACALAVLLRGICPETRVFTFSNAVVEVPARHGMALIDAIVGSQPHSRTYLGKAVEVVRTQAMPDADRLG